MSRSAERGGEWFTHSERGSVGLWGIEDWESLLENELDAAESHFTEHAGSETITATVVAFDEVDALSSEMQEHITETWSALAQAVDIERAGYVTDGIAAMAVTANVDAPGVELDSFESTDEAIQWAQS